MSFKEKLKQHFKGFEASPMLFVGSGLSRRYLGLECWDALLEKFTNQISENHVKLKTQSNGNAPEYAELLAASYSTQWWDSPEAAQIQEEYREHFQNESSVLKIEISRYLKDAHTKEVAPELLKELDLLKEANIDGIITTNWDQQLEHLFPQFSVFIGQDGLITGRSHGIAEIYKIHGCSSQPNSLVLTTSDYEEYRRKNPYLSSKLLTIFIERPVVFMGYAFADEHIAEILDDIVSCFPDKSLDFLRDKLLFVEWDPECEEPEISNSLIHKKIPVKLVRTNSFEDIFAVLSETKKRIPAHLFRTIKDELYELVLTDDPKGKLYVKDAEGVTEDVEQKEFIVGYGAISTYKRSESLPTEGLVGLDRIDLIREVIFENNKYDYLNVVNDVLPLVCKGNTRVPVFYYLNRAGLLNENGTLKDHANLTDGVAARFDINFLELRPGGGEAARAAKLPEITQGVDALYQAHDFLVFLRMLPFMEQNLIRDGVEDLQEIIKKHVDQATDSKLKSQFVRIVCIYDFIKYSYR